MLTDIYVEPQKNIYYIGARILQLLSRFKDGDEIELEWISRRLNKNRPGKQKIGIQYIVLALDWLFMLGLVDSGEKGRVKKCFSNNS